MKATEIVCRLVHSTLFGGRAVLPDGTDWYSVFDTACANRVCALCYKALNKLPKDARPDNILTDRWKEYAENVRKNYSRTCRVTQDLCEKLSGYGIVMLLLGGNALADCYPQRELREDDCVRFTANPGYREYNSALKDMGLAPVRSGNVTYFTYGGVTFCHCAASGQSRKNAGAMDRPAAERKAEVDCGSDDMCRGILLRLEHQSGMERKTDLIRKEAFGAFPSSLNLILC